MIQQPTLQMICTRIITMIILTQQKIFCHPLSLQNSNFVEDAPQLAWRPCLSILGYTTVTFLVLEFPFNDSN